MCVCYLCFFFCVCVGADNGSDPNVWKHTRVINVLGHFVADDYGVRQDWLRVKPKLWAVFVVRIQDQLKCMTLILRLSSHY